MPDVGRKENLQVAEVLNVRICDQLKVIIVYEPIRKGRIEGKQRSRGKKDYVEELFLLRQPQSLAT